MFHPQTPKAMEENPFKAIHLDIAALRDEFKAELKELRSQLQRQQQPKEYLTRKDICKQFSVSLPTVHNYMKQGLPYIKKGAKTLFKAQDVFEFFDKGKV